MSPTVQEYREQGFTLREAITKWETEEKINLQRQYCLLKNTPMFAPNTEVSYCCKKNIWEKISKEEASTKLISGCPHCHWSFVE